MDLPLQYAQTVSVGTGSGFLQVPSEMLVFFLTFAAVYGIITSVGRNPTGGRGGIFGNNQLNAIVAVVFGIFAAGNSEFVVFFEQNFGIMVWTFVGLFFVAFILEVFGVRKAMRNTDEMKQHSHKWMIIGGLALLFMVSVGFGILGDIQVPVIGTNNALMAIGLLFFAQMLYFAYHHSGGGGGGPGR